MGVDILAHQGLQLVQAKRTPNREYINMETGLVQENIIEIFDYHYFLNHAKPLEIGETYQYNSSKYFLSMSYTKIAGYPPIIIENEARYDHSAWNYGSGRFQELINFSDNSGIIGQDAIQKLLINFEQQELDGKDHEFNRMYYKVWDAFIFAQGDGLVRFS